MRCRIIRAPPAPLKHIAMDQWRRAGGKVRDEERRREERRRKSGLDIDIHGEPYDRGLRRSLPGIKVLLYVLRIPPLITLDTYITSIFNCTNYLINYIRKLEGGGVRVCFKHPSRNHN
ncbi:hypothetical protein PUN28_014966 [Cardiocondyla obscurior]|uniref:Uncharacterized protein n=1 Tax=Cardiocondyla obscurior TaxID=286306 RepID=A0AAW2F2B6_9HYME